jgi:hypothetical protein
MKIIQLGQKAKDVITGFEGVVIGIVAYLTGCKQALIVPRIGKDGKRREGEWFDVDRLEVVQVKPVALPLTSNGHDAPAPRR